MPSAASRQWYVLSEIFGANAAFADEYASKPQSRSRQLLHLFASVAGYCRSILSPRVAIIGDGVRWGSGRIQIIPNPGLGSLTKELARGRPVIFVRRPKDSPLYGELRFDDDRPLYSFLNGNGCLTISGHRRGEHLLAHIGRDDAGRDSVRRHANGLTNARAALMDTSIMKAIAQPVEQFERGQVSVLVQTFLDGQRARPSDDQRFLSVLYKTAEPLRQLHAATVDFEEVPEREHFERFKRDVVKIQEKEIAALVASVIEEASLWIGTRKPPAVRVHGDFSMANLLFDSGDNVTAIIDWEWTRDNGCAGFDAVQIAITAAAEYDQCDFAAIACEFAAGRGPKGVRGFLEYVLPLIDMREDDIPHLAKLYWLDLVFRGGVWTQSPNPRWWRKMVEPMAAIMGTR